MKLSILSILTGLAVVAAMPMAAPAQSISGTAQSGFSACTTNGATTLSYAIVSANSASGGAPIVTYVNAASDKANSRLQFYRVDAATSANFSNSTVTLPVNSTNGIGDGSGVIIIRHVASDTYEKRTLTTSTGSTNLVVTVAPLGTVAPGDLIYHATQTGAGCIRWGASTNSVGPSNGPLYSGQAGLPLLVEIDATTVGEVNVVSGNYVR